MGFKFLELVDQKRWQVIQNYFAEVMGSGVRVVDPDGAPLTALSRPQKYCFEIIASSSKAFNQCKDCILFSPKPHSPDALITRKDSFLDEPSNIIYDSCPFWTNRLLFPLKNDLDEVIAYVISGPFILGRRKSYPEYFKLSQELGVDVSQVLESIECMKVYSFNSLRSLALLFQEVSNYIIQRQDGAMKRMEGLSGIPNASASIIYRDKILEALLDTSVSVLGAEEACVMLLNEKEDSLFINKSRGIDSQSAVNTIVKMGEGKIGMAAKEDRVLFVDNRFQDQLFAGQGSKVTSPMASLSVPLKSGNRLIGILDLKTHDREHQFSNENINTVIELVRMADKALDNAAVRA